MRLLFLTCQPPHHMAPPRLADEQINCGPWFLDQKIGDYWVTRSTPYGDCDVTGLARELEEAQPPDLVVCHVDCGFGLRPKNLGAFKCPVVLIAADTHWGANAVSSMVKYAASEPFARIVTIYDRHHIGFYRAAGLKNVHWFPALTFTHDDVRVHAAEGQERSECLAIIGKTGYHARRQRMFAALIAAKIPLAWSETRQSEVIAHYGRASIGLNVAMNGDLNLRVFEILAGGAMLLTDKLAPAAGLDDLLVEGRHMVSYTSPGELVERARYYLANPSAAAEIGAAGKRWFTEHFSEDRRRRAFSDLAFNGRDLPEFEIDRSATDFDFGSIPFSGAMAAYDIVNELHRHQERVCVRIDGDVPPGVSGMLATLPRVNVLNAGEPAVADVAIIDATNKLVVSQVRGRYAWCWNVPKTGLPSLSTAFTQAGWACNHQQEGVFSGPKPPSSLYEIKVADAQRALAASDFKSALELARAALTANPRGADACLVMAEVAAQAKGGEMIRTMVAAARRAEPANPRVVLFEWAVANGRLPTQTQRYLAIGSKAYESLNFTVAIRCADLVIADDGQDADVWHLRGLAHAQLARHTDAATPLRRASLESFLTAYELAPRRGELAFALAVALFSERAWHEARWAFAKAAELTDDPWAWFGLLQVLLQLRDTDALEQTLREVAQRGFEFNSLSALSSRNTGWSGGSLVDGLASSAVSFTAAKIQKALGNQRAAFAYAIAAVKDEPDRVAALRLAAELAEDGLMAAGLNLAADTALDAGGLDAESHRLVLDTALGVAPRGALTLVRRVLHASDLRSDIALRVLHFAFSGVAHSGASELWQNPPAQQTTVLTFQPWFDFDYVSLLRRAYQHGVFMPLFGALALANDKAIADLEPEDFRAFQYRGASLWKLSQYNLAVALRCMPEAIDPKNCVHFDAIRVWYAKAAGLLDEAFAFVRTFRPESAIVAQGYDLTAAVMRHVCVAGGIRVVAIENTFHRKKLLWEDVSGIAVNTNLAKNFYWRFRDHIPAELAKITASAFLQSIHALKSGEHASGSLAQLDRPRDNGSPTIVYLGQVGTDSSVLFGRRRFANQVDAIRSVAEYALMRGARLVVKLHPKESPGHNAGGPWFRCLTSEWLDNDAGFQACAQQLRERLIVDTDNRYNTYSLIQQADVCVTMNSQSGLEALLYGKEVVLCGDAAFGGLGFTHEADSPESVSFHLDRILQHGYRCNDGVGAPCYFHIFTELYCVEKSEGRIIDLAIGRPCLPRALANGSDLSGEPSCSINKREPLPVGAMLR